MRGVDRERHEWRGCRDRGDDPHCADRETAVDGPEADEPGDSSERRREQLVDPRHGVAGDSHPEHDTGEADRLRHGEHREHGQLPGREATEEVPGAPAERRAEREQRRHVRLVVADGARCRLGVELVRVVQDGGLGGLRRLAVVVAADGVQELGEHRGVEVASPLLDHP